ncbi:helix-turn-helix domain-containing protein [Oscillatoria sp. FACHB-1407]|uniref:helix-turn-helix domain-containing protein n=1 Tax=Oscillatoria sp. FACHB-1407 TaxID=2692847 RepID=UPI001F548898|nr:helix-turn-helix transcriptional regulator [Oscillatoria sp. FACHB-1407]
MIEARKEAKLTQSHLAQSLKKPQSFVAKYENGERRLDVIEFLFVARAIGADPYSILQRVEQLSSSISCEETK